MSSRVEQLEARAEPEQPRVDGRPAAEGARPGPGAPRADVDARTGVAGDGWIRRAEWLWHFAYAFLVLVVALTLAGDRDTPWSFLLLGLHVTAYLLLLVPGMRGGPQAALWLRSYLLIAVVITLALGWIDSGGLLFLYAVFSQVFAVVQTRRRSWAALFALAGASMLVAMHHEARVAAFLQVMAALVVSVIIGGVSEALIAEALRRGELIRQLEQTRADLDAAHHEAGVLAERQRLSHEIHDTLAQGFTSLLMLIQAAESTVDTDPVATRERLALAERTARENLAEARSLVAALAPADLQTMPLEATLRKLTERAGAELGLRAECRVLGRPRELPADTQVVLVRVTQESLANVRKHAAAEAVEVSLHYRTAGVLLEVRDDGRGFRPGPDAASYGLRGMRARVEQAGGTVVVESAPGEGTAVRVEVP